MVTLTDSAKEYLKSVGKPNVLLSVKGGGCSGFQYDFSFDKKPKDDDMIFKEGGIDYLIDKVSIDFLRGSTLEYVSELAGSYFKIENPNATANCGCGTSFSI